MTSGGMAIMSPTIVVPLEMRCMGIPPMDSSTIRHPNRPS